MARVAGIPRADGPRSGARGLAAFSVGVHDRYKAKVANQAPVVVVPTGSVLLDWGLRVGGLPLGYLSEWVGPKDGGKSSAAIVIMREHQRMFPDRAVAYVNMENTFDPDRALLMGLDCSEKAEAEGRWVPLLPDHAEDVSDMARDMIGSGYCSCLVIDSVGAMESKRVMEKSAEDASKTVTPNSKIVTQLTKALSTEARLKQCSVLLINQPRAVVGASGIPDVSAGPKTMQHATLIKVDMKSLGDAEDVRRLRLPGETEDLIVSHKSRARFSRMKNGLPGRSVELYLNRVGTEQYGPPGIDDADGYLVVGGRQGIIQTGGAWYTFPDGGKANGRIAAAQYLRANPDAVAAIRERIQFDAFVPPADFDDKETANAANPA